MELGHIRHWVWPQHWHCVCEKKIVIERVQRPTSSRSIKPCQDTVNKRDPLQSPLVDPQKSHALSERHGSAWVMSCYSLCSETFDKRYPLNLSVLISTHSLELRSRWWTKQLRATGLFDQLCCHISAHCSSLISPSHTDSMYTHQNQSDYYDKDLPCFLFISFSFQRSVSPDPALNYDYYHSGRQADSFPRGTTATDPETLQLIWGSADQSTEWRTGGRGAREREWERRKQTCRLFTEKIAHG